MDMKPRPCAVCLFFFCLCLCASAALVSCNLDGGSFAVGSKQAVTVRNRTGGELTVRAIGADYSDVSLPQTVAPDGSLHFSVTYKKLEERWTLDVSYAGADYSYTVEHSFDVNIFDDDEGDLVIRVERAAGGGLAFIEE